VIVYHGTTIEHKEPLEREQWARTRGFERGSDGYVIFEIDVPDAAVVESKSWWWAEGQMLLPFGAPAEGLVALAHEDYSEDQQ